MKGLGECQQLKGITHFHFILRIGVEGQRKNMEKNNVSKEKKKKRKFIMGERERGNVGKERVAAGKQNGLLENKKRAWTGCSCALEEKNEWLKFFFSFLKADT